MRAAFVVLVVATAVAAIVATPPIAHALDAEPAPSPGVSPSVDPAADGAVAQPRDPSSGPGFFDFGGRIREAITSWFTELVASTLDAGLRLLGRTVLATPEVDGNGRVRELWMMSLAIADTAFVLLVLIGGAIVMSHETLQVRHTAKEIAPRILVAFVAANTSLFIAGQLIRFANALSQALLGHDVTADAVASTVHRLTLGPITAGPVGFGSMALVAVGVAAAVMLVLLLLVWIIRIAIVVVLVAGAPLLLALHALPQTEGMARMWWRSLAACLVVQVTQAFVLVTAVRVFFQPDGAALFGASAGDALVDMLMVVCLLFLLLRIPVWASRMVFNGKGSAIARTMRYVVVTRAVRGVVLP